jgi:hypothetical protein
MRFDTEIVLTGPFRSPKQMLEEQITDGQQSVHDEEVAAKVGLKGAPIEGPTHFSQFDPLAVTLWGTSWFEHGCISSHFRTMVIEGEQVQASMTSTGATTARVAAVKSTGEPVLAGSASIGPDHPVTELEARRAAQGDPGELFIVDLLEIGMKSKAGAISTMDHPSRNGPMYPFSLDEKLVHITEPHPWYTEAGGASSPWGRAIIPFEMISVLAMKATRGFPIRMPSFGLFLDLEVRVHGEPLFVDQPYEVVHELVGLSQSRKTESFWTNTAITDPATGALRASVLLHRGVFKNSYPGYPQDRLAP